MNWRTSTIVGTTTLVLCLGMTGLLLMGIPKIPAKDTQAKSGTIDEIIQRAEKKWATLQTYWLFAPTVSESLQSGVKRGLRKMKENQLFIKEKLGNKYKLKRLRKSLDSYAEMIDTGVQRQYKEIKRVTWYWIWGLLLLSFGMLLSYIPIPEINNLIGLAFLFGWWMIGGNLLRGESLAWFMIAPIVATISWIVVAAKEV